MREFVELLPKIVSAPAPLGQFNDHGDRLAPAAVGEPYHHHVPYSVVGQKEVLDLIGIYLLAAAVDAGMGPADEVYDSVIVHRTHISHFDPGVALHLYMGLRRLLGILPVADGLGTTVGQYAHLPRAGLHETDFLVYNHHREPARGVDLEARFPTLVVDTEMLDAAPRPRRSAGCRRSWCWGACRGISPSCNGRV